MFEIRTSLGGISATAFDQDLTKYQVGLAHDPDFPIADSGDQSYRPSGAVFRPVAYQKFSGSNVTANVVAQITNPKDAKVYAVLSNGRIISYDSALGTETLVGTVAGSNAEGAFYYNNYLYVTGTGSGKDDMSRYGPLDNSPTLADNVWKGATLGSQTGLGDVTYPNLRGSGHYPKHWGFVHVDGAAYVCDNLAGVGYLHKIKTKKVTSEGDTNDTTIPTAYGALTFPTNMLPMAADSFGNDIAILCIQTNDSTLDQGDAVMFLWDTTSPSFYAAIPIPMPLATAIKNVNGVMRILAGKASGGHTLYQYLYGRTVKPLCTVPEGAPPAAGAIEAIGDRVLWGSYQTIPANSACVWAYGSKDGAIPDALHNIATATASASASDGLVTALKFAEQGSLELPKLIIGWRDANGMGIDKLSTTYQTHYYWGPKAEVGQPYRIDEVVIVLGAAVAANMTLTPTWHLDDKSTSTAGTVINNTNYANSERVIRQFPAITGKNDFFLELKSSGTALLPVKSIRIRASLLNF